MKELEAINGIYSAVSSLADTFLGRAYYNDKDDLPVIAVMPAESDRTVARLAIAPNTEYNITASVVVEAHVETEPTDLSPVYTMWKEITKAVFAWTPTTASDKITLEYTGKNIIIPDEANNIAVVQVNFDVKYIEDLGV